MIANHFHGAKTAVRGALRLAGLGQSLLSTQAMASLGSALHKGLALPLWTPSTPRAYNASRALSSPKTAQNGHEPADSALSSPKTAQNGHETGPDATRPKVVYFPSCLNQMMGLPAVQQAATHAIPQATATPPQTATDAAQQKAPDAASQTTPPTTAIQPTRPLAEETVALLHKAGYEVIFPARMDSLCCGMIWESKGMPETADKKTAELEEALWIASEQGRYPVLCDQSPCLHRMRAKIHRMKLYEPVEFIHDFLMDRLQFRPTDGTVAVHVTCSTRLMGLGGKLIALARRCAKDVIVPEGVGCCGFAGDKGMTHPELNAYALRKLRAQVNPATTAANPAGSAANPATAGFSNSRTCEIGLTTHSGIPYQSIVYLVNACTESASTRQSDCR